MRLRGKEKRRKKRTINKTIPPKLDILTAFGKLTKTRKGFGFIILDEPEIAGGKDIFIAPSVMGKAMNGDYVEVEISGISLKQGHPEGVITRILKRHVYEVVGTFKEERGVGWVVPENRKSGEELIILKKNYNGAKNGDKVVAGITRLPDGRNRAEGKIKEIIGKSGDPRIRERALIRAYGMSESFPGQVLSEALVAPKIINEEETSKRKDLRDQRVITIDGADAKDLDDAISIRLLENGNYELGVHIADVSHYVKEGKALDEEALRRGCSVYLIDIVLPMLPQELSNGICSLNPHVDRLTLTVNMEIDQQGKVLRHEIYESVIRSMERMIYTDVSDLLEKSCDDKRYQDLMKRYEHIYDEILLMEGLAKILKNKRQERGSLNFDFDEAFIKLDENGVPLAIDVAERRVANGIIEEFMIAANETVAEHYFLTGLPFVYRIHEKPAVDKMEEFQRMIRRFGLKISKKGDIDTKELNEILGQVEGEDSEHLINTLLLRSMKKASYDTECKGHFGLGADYYCHFTSPIRRYPDLIIHRIIKERMKGPLNVDRTRILQSRTDMAASASSVSERMAEELEREMDKLKMAEYMQGHLGEEYEGIISGFSASGIFVEILDVIEGRVSLDSMNDDYYIYEEENYRYIGKLGHKVYALGGKVRVMVAGADPDLREISLEMIP